MKITIDVDTDRLIALAQALGISDAEDVGNLQLIEAAAATTPPPDVPRAVPTKPIRIRARPTATPDPPLQ